MKAQYNTTLGQWTVCHAGSWFTGSTLSEAVTAAYESIVNHI